MVTTVVFLCRWIEETWGTAHSQNKTENVQSILTSASSIVTACIDVAAANAGERWAVGTNADESQLAAFLNACYEIASCTQPVSPQSGVDALKNAEHLSSFIGGDQPCIAEFIVWPFISRALLCVKELNPANVVVGSSAYNEQKHGQFQLWVDSMMRLPAVQMAAADEGLLVDAWRRTRRMDWFDYETVPVGQLHPHLAVM
jgi:glutathione S-transferase